MSLDTSDNNLNQDVKGHIIYFSPIAYKSSWQSEILHLFIYNSLKNVDNVFVYRNNLELIQEKPYMQNAVNDKYSCCMLKSTNRIYYNTPNSSEFYDVYVIFSDMFLTFLPNEYFHVEHTKRNEKRVLDISKSIYLKHIESFLVSKNIVKPSVDLEAFVNANLVDIKRNALQNVNITNTQMKNPHNLVKLDKYTRWTNNWISYCKGKISFLDFFKDFLKDSILGRYLI